MRVCFKCGFGLAAHHDKCPRCGYDPTPPDPEAVKVDRVARLIAAEEALIEWDELTENWRDRYRMTARKVIDALDADR